MGKKMGREVEAPMSPHPGGGGGGGRANGELSKS